MRRAEVEWSDAEIDQTIDELDKLVPKGMIHALEHARDDISNLLDRELQARGFDADEELSSDIKIHVWHLIENRLWSYE